MSDEKTAKNRERGVLVLRVMLLPGRDALSRRHYNIVIMIVNSVHAIGFLFAPEERHGEDKKKKKNTERCSNNSGENPRNQMPAQLFPSYRRRASDGSRLTFNPRRKEAGKKKAAYHNTLNNYYYFSDKLVSRTVHFTRKRLISRTHNSTAMLL